MKRKIFIILILILSIFTADLIFNTNNVKATTASDIISQGKDFIDKGSGQNKLDTNTLEEKIIPIGNIVEAVAILIALVVGMILGVRYMISGADEKANLKQHLIWYVVGLFLIFGAVGIYNIFAKIMNNVIS